ncbi:MAG: ATP phosphoribosyltransferase [Pseudomonadota bacterium]
MEEQRLRIAIQKSGRLSDGSLELLKACGLTISRGRDKLYARVAEMPIDILLVRDDDIPGFIADGVCDVGVIGENVFEEWRLSDGNHSAADIIERLGFSRCRLALAVANAEEYTSIKDLEGRRVATSYPAILKEFLSKAGVSAHIVKMEGSVEVAPRIKVADAICDIVSTGATLEANGLKLAETIFQSEAVLVRNALSLSPEKQSIFEALLVRIRGVLQSRESKYVMMNAPRASVEAIREILPGAEAPTILELAGQPDKVAIHAVCRESVFWSTLEKLKKEGAKAILVLPIEKMML